MLDTATETTPMTIADRIRQLRKEHGLTQDDLAAKAGVGVATIQRVERGESPSAGTIASIAAAFNLTPDALTVASKARTEPSATGSYLPLSPITSGKHLVDMIAEALRSILTTWISRVRLSQNSSAVFLSSVARVTSVTSRSTQPNVFASIWRLRSCSRNWPLIT